jgi:peptidoglycan/xylan/chitin deacetylase (PgdA/CDA1 family)
MDAMSAVIPPVEVERVTALRGDLVGALIRGLQPAEILAVVDNLRLRWQGICNWSDLYLSESELDDLSANGASFQAHGYDHWALTCLTPQALDAELENGRDAIEHRFGTRPGILALAHGLGGDRELEAARRAGFEHVVIGSLALFPGDGYEVPRIWPRGSSVEVSWMLSKALLAAAWNKLRLLFRRGPTWTA